MLREIAVGNLMGTTSGSSMILGIRTAGGKFPNRTTGLESHFGAEVVKAAAGMTREEANEIAKRLLPKYEDELKHPQTGVTFPECFDVKTVKPKKEWQDIYLKIKKEVSELGVPFKSFE
jgi:methylamine--corrinoid protein Co-methyltransferase